MMRRHHCSLPTPSTALPVMVVWVSGRFSHAPPSEAPPSASESRQHPMTHLANHQSVFNTQRKRFSVTSGMFPDPSEQSRSVANNHGQITPLQGMYLQQQQQERQHEDSFDAHNADKTTSTRPSHPLVRLNPYSLQTMLPYNLDTQRFFSNPSVRAQLLSYMKQHNLRDPVFLSGKTAVRLGLQLKPRQQGLPLWSPFCGRALANVSQMEMSFDCVKMFLSQYPRPDVQFFHTPTGPLSAGAGNASSEASGGSPPRIMANFVLGLDGKWQSVDLPMLSHLNHARKKLVERARKSFEWKHEMPQEIKAIDTEPLDSCSPFWVDASAVPTLFGVHDFARTSQTLLPSLTGTMRGTSTPFGFNRQYSTSHGSAATLPVNEASFHHERSEQEKSFTTQLMRQYLLQPSPTQHLASGGGITSEYSHFAIKGDFFYTPLNVGIVYNAAQFEFHPQVAAVRDTVSEEIARLVAERLPRPLNSPWRPVWSDATLLRQSEDKKDESSSIDVVGAGQEGATAADRIEVTAEDEDPLYMDGEFTSAAANKKEDPAGAFMTFNVLGAEGEDGLFDQPKKQVVGLEAPFSRTAEQPSPPLSHSDDHNAPTLSRTPVFDLHDDEILRHDMELDKMECLVEIATATTTAPSLPSLAFDDELQRQHAAELAQAHCEEVYGADAAGYLKVEDDPTVAQDMALDREIQQDEEAGITTAGTPTPTATTGAYPLLFENDDDDVEFGSGHEDEGVPRGWQRHHHRAHQEAAEAMNPTATLIGSTEGDAAPRCYDLAEDDTLRMDWEQMRHGDAPTTPEEELGVKPSPAAPLNNDNTEGFDLRDDPQSAADWKEFNELVDMDIKEELGADMMMAASSQTLPPHLDDDTALKQDYMAEHQLNIAPEEDGTVVAHEDPQRATRERSQLQNAIEYAMTGNIHQQPHPEGVLSKSELDSMLSSPAKRILEAQLERDPTLRDAMLASQFPDDIPPPRGPAPMGAA